MMKLFVASNCQNCQSAEAFLKEQQQIYTRINLSYEPLDEKDLVAMLFLVDSDFFKIFNIHAFGQQKEYASNPTTLRNQILASKKAFIAFLLQNPHMFSYPMLLNYNEQNVANILLIGYEQAVYQNALNNLESQDVIYENVNALYKFSGCCFYCAVKNQ